ncbi:unnamed protein product [Acanthosepion pharaonis]|uniref:Uncharacterized protein n=1 Tax=Acanthosepion pharaonis TaxID=158019 RepID=A0A812E1K4_ACAPH|nr:unnamed protein product [Sepia pharaonis]
MHVYLSNTGPKYIITYLYIQFSFFIIVLSFLFHVSSFLSLFFSCHEYDFTHCPAVTEIYTFFLSLVFLFLSFFLSSSVYSSVSNTIQLQQGYTLSSSLWFSLFFKRRLYSQRPNSFASSVINNASYRLQFGVIEQKYMFLYFLSGVAWDESDKFHYYQMSLIFPFISYQRFNSESCSFKDKTATDSQVIF